MTKRVQIVGHNTTGADAFTGLSREVTVDTTKSTLRVHDGSTPGGHEIAKADASNIQAATNAQDGKMTAALVLDLETAQADLLELFRHTRSKVAVDCAGGVDVTPTAVEAANLYIELTGAVTAPIEIIMPLEAFLVIFEDNTTGGNTIKVRNSSMGDGNGVALTNGELALIASDGVTVQDALGGVASHVASTSNPHSVTAAQAGAFAIANLLSEVTNAFTARGNLGIRFGWAGGDTVQAGTNLISASEEFDLTAYWTTVGSSISAGSTTAPNGKVSADKLVENSANSQHYVSQTYTVVSGRQYVYTVFGKAAERDELHLDFTNTAFPANAHASFDLTTGLIDLEGAGLDDAFMDVADNGFYRCSIVATANASVANAILINILNGGSDTYLGDGSSGFHLWGAQLSENDAPEGYVRTASAPLTMAAQPGLIGGFISRVDVRSAAHTVESDLSAVLYVGDTSGGAFTFTLPPLADVSDGFTAFFKNDGANDLTIDGNAAETIDGIATSVLTDNETIGIAKANGEWKIVSSRDTTVRIETFTSSGSFVKAADDALVYAQAWGGGGAGGKSADGGGGGGGGAWKAHWLDLNDWSASETITIGAGAPALVANGSAAAGGDTSVGAHFTIYGGGGGAGAASGGGGGGGGQLGAGVSTTSTTGRNGGAPNSDTVTVGKDNEGAGGGNGNSGLAASSHGGNSSMGGGGGGGGHSATDPAGNGGNSVHGAGGGGGGQGGTGAGGTGGNSDFGGTGGDGETGAGVVATAGAQPGGGGGGGESSGDSGAGGDGLVILIVIKGRA